MDTSVATKIEQVKKMVQYHQECLISVGSSGDFFFLSHYHTPEDKTPYRIVKIAHKTVRDMDWSMATMLVMNATSEPIAAEITVTNPLPFDYSDALITSPEGGSNE